MILLLLLLVNHIIVRLFGNIGTIVTVHTPRRHEEADGVDSMV